MCRRRRPVAGFPAFRNSFAVSASAIDIAIFYCYAGSASRQAGKTEEEEENTWTPNT
jgi:hypothetical protein